MQAVSIVLGHCVDVSSVAAEKIDNIIMTLVAGKMDRAPIVQTLPVYLNRIAVLPFQDYIISLVILSIFAILPQFFVVLVDIDPEVPPVELKICDI